MSALARTTEINCDTRAANEDCINGGSRTRTKLGYDVLDRINSAAKTGTSYGWTYDADGNRLAQTGTGASTFTPSPTSNRLNSTTGALARTYSYDSAGNAKTYSNLTFTYNQRGRESGVTVGSTASSYIYSAVGQLIKKTAGSTTTLLMYDETGHLLGEYTSAGTLIQETIWMGDIPVATLRPNGSTACTTTICVFYVHTDQLNAPRKITRPSDNKLAWRWDADPFGTAAPNQNPASLGTFIYNLRFPGQYALTETGLNYNYFRDFDPQTGRYIEPDPIGQLFYFSMSTSPGVSVGHHGYWNHLYNYVDNDPVVLKDPTGLGRFDWLWDLFKEKSPEQITTKGLAAGFGVQCIAQNCGKARNPIDLFGDCASILDAWIKKMGAGAIGIVNGINADGGQGVVSECAELCEKGISSGSCCNKGQKQ